MLRVIREVVAPLVRADGGRLYVVKAQEDALDLHLAGRFAGCPGNTLATRRVIEPAIFAVAPSAKVTISSGALVPKDAELIT
ncbi:MAG TPA: NifU family protein [Polyangiaceae bacterium]|nr:NifU family protein [Polyangiaceae bacterium]